MLFLSHWTRPVRAPLSTRRRERHVVLSARRLDYKAAGVDIDAGSELVRRIRRLNPEIGGFNGRVPFGAS